VEICGKKELDKNRCGSIHTCNSFLYICVSCDKERQGSLLEKEGKGWESEEKGKSIHLESIKFSSSFTFWPKMPLITSSNL